MNTPNNMCVDVCAALPVNGTAANANALGGIGADSYALKSELNSLADKVALQAWATVPGYSGIYYCFQNHTLFICSIGSIVYIPACTWQSWFTLSDFSYPGGVYVPCVIGTTYLKPGLFRIFPDGTTSIYCSEQINNESAWLYAAIPIDR